jgi:hypothetical protein
MNVTMSPYRHALSVILALAVAADNPWTPRAGRSARASEPGPESYSLEVKTVAGVVGTLTYDIAYPDIRASEWVVCASQAPALPGQIKVRTSLNPAGASAHDETDLARGLLMARVPADAQHVCNALSIQTTYEMTLRSRKLRRGSRSPRDANLSPAERAMFLAARGDMDFQTPAFKEWLTSHGLQRRSQEGEISFGRRVFLELKSGMQYDASSSQELRASAVCTSGRSDCGGLSVLFTSILRANKIPARTLWGRWAFSAEPGKTWANRPYFQTHVKAEFFARGVGWVPVDLASGILHDKSPQGLRFFGNDPGDFITFHVDPNFVVDTHLSGAKPVPHMQCPAWWLKGQGSLKDAKIVQDWQVKRTKVD